MAARPSDHQGAELVNGCADETLLSSSASGPGGGSSEEDAAFDRTVEALQSIVLEDEFCHLHEAFLAKHCHYFEDCEENKHVYMDVFRSYTDIVEKYIESRLLERVPGFTMAAFQLSLKQRQGEIDEALLDMLLSFSDFATFKQAILDYRKEKEGQGVELMVSASSLTTGKPDC